MPHPHPALGAGAWFRYPLALDALAIIGVVSVLRLIPAPIGSLLGILSSVYLFQVITVVLLTTARSGDTFPSAADLAPNIASLRTAFIHGTALVMICFGPALFVVWLPIPESYTVPIALALGCVYFPMALLGIVLGDRIGGASPARIGPALRQVGRAYIPPVAGLAILLGVALLLDRLVQWIPGSPWVQLPARAMSSGVHLYLLIVWVRTLGLFYRRHRDALSLEPNSEEQEPDEGV